MAPRTSRHTSVVLTLVVATLFALPAIALADTTGSGERNNTRIPDHVTDEEILERELLIAEETVTYINRLRVDEGLEPLALWPDDEVARHNAKNYERDHALYIREGAGAENYGVRAHEVWTGVAHASGAVNSWSGSPGHYEALVDPNATHVVVGVSCDIATDASSGGSVVAHLLLTDEAGEPAPVADRGRDYQDIPGCFFGWGGPNTEAADLWWLPYAGMAAGGLFGLLLLRWMFSAFKNARRRREIRSRPWPGRDEAPARKPAGV